MLADVHSVLIRLVNSEGERVIVEPLLHHCSISSYVESLRLHIL